MKRPLYQMVFVLMPLLATTALGQETKEAPHRFQRTRVIGDSQVGASRGRWYVAGGVFESIVGKEYYARLGFFNCLPGRSSMSPSAPARPSKA